CAADSPDFGLINIGRFDVW
nr:immunoglobulin heavy chain junction region [Macaca mulatta]